MQDYEKQTIGEIIERLIYIKDNYDIEYRGNLEAINNACNIIAHHFNACDSANTLLHEHVVNIHWRYEDIAVALIKKGFSSSEKNIETVIERNPGLEKYLQEQCTEIGWAVINNAISECKDSLEPVPDKEE